jgi:CelD/BcsL family acetyltransferase involved in cellulose biosynthesis
MLVAWVWDIAIQQSNHLGHQRQPGDLMHLTILKTNDDFMALADEWNDILAHSASHVPFLRHEYLYNWWLTLGGGEWEHGSLNIVAARRNDGTLCAIAPLFFTHNLEGEQALMLLGSIEISDYLDLIAPAGEMPDFLAALLPRLAEADVPPWQVIDLYNLLEDSPTLTELKSATQALGWNYEQQQLQHCPYIPLPGDWETYLAGIDKKQRHEIRRKMRRLENADLPMRWYIVDDDSRLDEEIEAFLALMAQDEEKKSFLTAAMRTQMKEAVRAAFRESWLQLAFIEIGGAKAAGYLNFDFAGHIWVYNSGLDYGYASYSPGWVLLAYLLQWAIEHRRTAFDFMRGSEDYKYRFGAVDRRVVRAQIRR